MPVDSLSIATTPRTYAELRRSVEAVFLRGQHDIDVAQVRMYWTTGDLIHRHVLGHEDRAGYGLEVVARLAQDLGVGRRSLYRCLQFRRAYEIVSARTPLLWAHYRVLMLIEDRGERDTLECAAAEQGWNSRQLEERVRPLLLAQQDATAPPANARAAARLLTPKRGTPGVHRLVPGAETLAVDLGFTSFFELTPEQAREFKQGELVRIDAAGRITRADDAKSAELYTYRADCLRVVDGDTIWLRVHLRPRHWLKEKVRLRGLDCPEIDTAEGRAAKRFVESLMARAQSVTITTTKPDKYDRYLADVFVQESRAESPEPRGGSAESDLDPRLSTLIPRLADGVVFLNNALLETGHAVRKEEWSTSDWEQDESNVPR